MFSSVVVLLVNVTSKALVLHATQLLVASHAQLQAIDGVDFGRGSMQLAVTHLGKEIAELESEREYAEEGLASYGEAINQRRALISTLSRMAVVD
jgi:hypothetical protein